MRKINLVVTFLKEIELEDDYKVSDLNRLAKKFARDGEFSEDEIIDWEFEDIPEELW